MSSLLTKLASITDRYYEVAKSIVDPEIINDQKKYSKLMKEYKDLEKVVDIYKNYKNVLENIDSSKTMLKEEDDPEMKEMAKEELGDLLSEQSELEEKIQIVLIPKDPEDTKDVIVEIRQGAGGDEAGIFAGDLYRMYTKFIEDKGWKKEIITINEGTSGGFKEVVFSVSGNEVYGTMKYESGVHRVQRVPQTESQGRVHTSAVSVAVLPEADEVDVKLDMSDVRKDTYRASGAGGQHVNKTESAVRIVHIPTNTVVECQEGRSQIKNRVIAMGWLRTKLYDKAIAEHNEKMSSKRKNLVSSGDRSAKIRTYNYPQGRVTDHRIGLTLYHLDAIVGGNVDLVIDKLKMEDQANKLAEMEGI